MWGLQQGELFRPKWAPQWPPHPFVLFDQSDANVLIKSVSVEKTYGWEVATSLLTSWHRTWINHTGMDMNSERIISLSIGPLFLESCLPFSAGEQMCHPHPGCHTAQLQPLLICLIKQVGNNCFRYSCNVSCAYKKLPLDPVDWPLVCLKVQGYYYINISLPFGLRWAAACCQDMTSLIITSWQTTIDSVGLYWWLWGHG